MKKEKATENSKTPEEISGELHKFFNEECVRYACKRNEKNGRLEFYDVRDASKKVDLPKEGGVYVFFQNGEEYKKPKQYRIVRVGIAADLNRRMREHFRGNPGPSVFCRKIGFALLYKDLKKNGGKGYDFKLFAEWAKSEQKGSESKKLKKDVSDYMCENFSFSIMKVGDEKKRRNLEDKIISTISRDKNFGYSPDWDGKYLIREMWLDQGLRGDVLNDREIEGIKKSAVKTQ